MNKQQRITMMAELWPEACEYQKWNRNDKQARYDLFARVLTAPDYPERDHYLFVLQEKGHISFNDFNEDAYSAVKKELLDLAGKTPLKDGRKEKKLWVIRNRQLPCIALYRDADAYLKTVLRARFRIFNGLSTMEDLSDAPRIVDGKKKPSQLMMLIFTLDARINELRNEAGDTIHEMNQRARVECKTSCRECYPLPQVAMVPAPDPDLDNVPF